MAEKREKERAEDLTLDRETFETAVKEIWRKEPPPKKQEKGENEQEERQAKSQH